MMTSKLYSSRIHVLAEPSVTVGRSYDIIVLHGLGGHFEKSWTSRDGYCWLSLALAPKYPNCRILSISQPTLLQDLAATPLDLTGIIADLSRERSSSNRADARIIFVGQSFGGTLLKQLYAASHPTRTDQAEFRQINRCIHAYVYLGTPHRQISQLDVRALWRTLEQESFVTLRGRSSSLEAALDNTWRINSDFRDLGGEELPTLCFYETIKMRVGITDRLIVTRIEAILNSRPVESTPLDSSHQKMGIFHGPEDNNLLRLLASFDRLATTLNGTAITRPPYQEERPLKLLSLDGGGVKGLFTMLVLRKLIEEVQRLEGDAGQRKLPCDYFDLIAGTSTGGLLAIMLGRLQMDIASCIRTYRDLSKEIFKRNMWFPLVRIPEALLGYSWYSGEVLKSAICRTVKEHMSAHERDSIYAGGYTESDVRLSSTEAQRTRCFVCAVPEGQHKVDRIRSYRPLNGNARDTSAYTIWEAARATSAAPMYFPAIQVQSRHYFDGGVESNNPVVEVIEEARSEFPGRRIDTVISIGTGKGRHVDPRPPFHNVLLSFIQRATNTEAQHQRILTENAFEDVRGGYFRFQADFSLGDIDLADADQLDEIERLADLYLTSEEGERMIRSCAVRLAASA